MHQQLAQHVAVVVAPVRREDGFRDAFVQMLTDFIDGKEGDHRLVRARRKHNLGLVHRGLSRRCRRKALGLRVRTDQLTQQRRLAGASCSEKQRSPIIGILGCRQGNYRLANRAEVVLLWLHAVIEDLHDSSVKPLFGLGLGR